MALFRELNSTLKMLKTRQIDKEKELQLIVEKNLFEVLDMYFLASEYATTFGGRIDTLAVDTFGCPVIIEYKRNKNDNVINQALSYLKWLQSQKQEFFEMLIQKKLNKESADRIQLDWKNPRVICIAESYSKFDIDTVEVIPMRIELYKYKFYEEGIFSIDPVNIPETKEVKVKVTTTDIITTDYEALLSKGNKQIQELFLELRSRIFQIDEAIEERITSLYIAYRLSKSFAEVHIGTKQIKVYLRPIEYETNLLEVEKIPDGYNWTLNRRIYIKELGELDAAIKLIEKSYEDVI